MGSFLRAENICKSFPGVPFANDHVSFDVNKGEVHTILGENGAGKTVFSSILYGMYKPDAGRILLNDKEVRFDSPRDAISAGIGMIHQHFMLVPVFTVAQNVVLGLEPRKRWFKPEETVKQKTRQLSDEYCFGIDPNAKVGDLPVGMKQRVEILKMLYRDVNLLILDEPTAVLTPQEAEMLIVNLRSLVDKGMAVILITHFLKEALEFSDRITVMRNGKVEGTSKAAEADEESLARMMVGRDVVFRIEKPEVPQGDVALKVEGLNVMSDRHHKAVSDVSFDVRKGEILGIAGVDGNGQKEIAEALFGIRKLSSGKVELLGTDVTGFRPRQLLEKGMRIVVPDRDCGLVRSYDITENLILDDVCRPPYSKNGFIQWKEAEKQADESLERFLIRASSRNAKVSNLSGGNQQKVLMAKALKAKPRVLVVSQPTRGLDVGAIENVRRMLLQAKADGMAILLISTDLEEILSLSDRVGVIFRGTMQAILDEKEAGRERVGALMAGLKGNESPRSCPQDTGKEVSAV